MAFRSDIGRAADGINYGCRLFLTGKHLHARLLGQPFGGIEIFVVAVTLDPCDGHLERSHLLHCLLDGLETSDIDDRGDFSVGHVVLPDVL